MSSKIKCYLASKEFMNQVSDSIDGNLVVAGTIEGTRSTWY